MKGDGMHISRIARTLLPAVVILVAAITLMGCASKCGTGVDVTKGTVLEYRMSEGDPISYEFLSDNTQTLDVGGQSVKINSSEMMLFSVTPKGVKDGDQAIGITIDDLYVAVSAAGTTAESDAAHVIGQSFEMTVSQSGVEAGLPEPDLLEYMIGNEGPKSAITGFGVIFPDLPDGPIEVGGTWPTTVEVVEQDDNSNVTVTIEAVNTLVGFETINGLECAKISAVLMGTIEGGGTQGGAEWTMSSTMDGGGVWYFAHERGIFVSDSTEGTADGTITVNAPDGEQTLPVTRDFTMLAKLVQ